MALVYLVEGLRYILTKTRGFVVLTSKVTYDEVKTFASNVEANVWRSLYISDPVFHGSLKVEDVKYLQQSED